MAAPVPTKSTPKATHAKEPEPEVAPDAGAGDADEGEATAPEERGSSDAEAETLAPEASQEVAAAAEAASKLGGDYAPLVAIVLAAIAVLGGSKAWAYYKDRAAQKHELALKQLEMQAQAQVPTVQPPPCQAAQAKVEAQLAEHSTQMADLQRRQALADRKTASLPDVDLGDLDERVAKLERKAKRKS